MALSIAGFDFVQELCAALNLPRTTQRVVIEIDIMKYGPMPRMYVQSLLDEESGSALVEAVKELSVSENGEVSVELLPPIAEEC